MGRFRLTVKAKWDLRTIAEFTQSRWDVAQRDRYIKQLDDAFHWLAERPGIGTECSAIREGYRKFPQGSHVIFYQEVAGSGIDIVRILHKRMDVDSRL